MSVPNPGGPNHPSSSTSADDIKRVAQFAGFVVGAARRRKSLTVAVFLATLALVGVFLAVSPKTYMVETRILTHKSYVLPALVSPRRAVPMAADSPTQGAEELVKSRENLDGIITEARLIESWDENRSAVGKLKDAVRRAIFGPLTEQEFRDALAELLDERLIVYIDNQDVVVMRITWHNALAAVNIAEVTQRRFLRARKERELREVSETVTILTKKTEESSEELAQATKDVSDLLDAKGAKGQTRLKTVRVRRSGSTRGGGTDADTAAQKLRLERELSEVRVALSALQSEYQRRLQEAQSRLNALKQSLGPAHPDVQLATRTVDERSRPPAELSFLKSEEAELVAELKRMDRAEEKTDDTGAVTKTIRVPVEVSPSTLQAMQNDPEVERALSTLQTRISRHNELVERLSEAETEVEVANAAFEYRYVITLPPIMPTRHIKPKVPMTLAAGVMAALMLAVMAAVAADLLSRRVIEPWQVEVFAGVPVLGVVKLDEAKQIGKSAA